MLHLSILCLTLLAEPGAATSPRLAVIQPAPDFRLTTHASKTLRLADLRGKVLLVGFVFTTCSGSCPATTHRMGQIQQALQARGLDQGGRVQLLSISLDPARDTPEVLRRYMRLYDVDEKNWTFLTGEPEQVLAAVTAWGMWAKPAANGQLDHPSRVFLVDPHGRVREIYNLDFLKPKWVLEDVELLLQEATK